MLLTYLLTIQLSRTRTLVVWGYYVVGDAGAWWRFTPYDRFFQLFFFLHIYSPPYAIVLHQQVSFVHFTLLRNPQPPMRRMRICFIGLGR